MKSEDIKEYLEFDYIDPISADKFNRIISAKMADAKSEEIKMLREQLDFIKEQAKDADKYSKWMFIIAMGSLMVTALSVVIQLIL